MYSDTADTLARPAKSAVFSVDPRLGIVAVAAAAVVSLFLLSSVPAMIAPLVYLAAWYFAAGGRIAALWTHTKRIIWFVVFIFALNGLIVPGEALLSVGPWTVLSREGVAAGVFFFLRLLVLYLSMVVLFLAVPPEKFAQGIFWWCRPLSAKAASRLAFYSFLALSFLPLFAREYERVLTAQSFRGGGFGGGLKRRLSSVRLLLVPLILSAVHRSGQLAAVVELRNLKNRMGITMAPGRLAFGDYLFMVVTVIVLVLAVAVLNRSPGV